MREGVDLYGNRVAFDPRAVVAVVQNDFYGTPDARPAPVIELYLQGGHVFYLQVEANLVDQIWEVKCRTIGC